MTEDEAVPEEEIRREGPLPEASEADLLEQSKVVEEEQRRELTERRDDVPEADWLEQSVEEEYDDDHM